MGREQTLLERIAARSRRGPGRYQASATEDLDALMESVRGQLARLLNARHGMSEALPEYGLPALTDLTVGSGDYVQRVLDAIQHTIESYEPRLRRVRVTRVADDERPHQALRFRIDATLVGEDGQHRVWYETEFGGGGQFDVSD